MRPQTTTLAKPTAENVARQVTRDSRVLTRNVSFGSSMSNTDTSTNMDCAKFTGTSPGSANTDFTLKHSLGRVPLTIVGQDTNSGAVLYRSPATAWTKTTVTLRSTGASSVYNLIIA